MDAQFEFMEIFTFEALHIVIIQKFKFQTMCIKVHNSSNINNTSFDLENVQYQPEYKLAINNKLMRIITYIKNDQYMVYLI